MQLIADEKIIFHSPDAAGIYCFTPAVVLGNNGRIIAAVDLGGPGTAALGAPLCEEGDYPSGNQIRFLLSDDDGKSWRESACRIPMRHEILFRDGETLYAMGNARSLVISRSDDNGENWSDPAVLFESKGRPWHQSATTPYMRNGKIYLVQERYNPEGNSWPNVQQFLMAGIAGSDLCRKENWRFSAPFNGDPICAVARPLCDLAPNWFTGILETHLLPISKNCGHLYREGENAFLLCSRFNTPGFQQGAIFKGIEHADGTLEITLFPSRMKDIPLFNVPFPGAAVKFHVLFDEVSQLYYLIANQPRCVFEGEFIGSRSNRRKLMLWCARDGVSWQPLGTVAYGPSENGARSYAQMVISGEDLLIIARSGDEKAKSEHDNNIVTFHRVKNFRALAGECGY